VTLGVHLRLGRVSNLPTVWSNVLAGAVLAGLPLQSPAALLLAMLGFSCLYIGGMYLNDACDADTDARERPDRPIPSGAISRSAVRGATLAWFLLGPAFLGAARTLSPTGSGIGWLLATLALIACIVIYDLHHKGNRFGPLWMAACRSLVYLGAALTLTGAIGTPVLVGAALAFAWIAGLTAFAKQEGGQARTAWAWPVAVLLLPVLIALTEWQHASIVLPLALATVGLIALARHWMRRRGAADFPAAIGLLIAGVSLVDALAIAAIGYPVPAMLALGCGALTLLLQRRIAGT